MGSDGALLENLAVLQEAHDRAEEIRNEIATLKGKTGASNAVTVPQLLKGDAIPDVAEPEGKPDAPESRLQYHASTPSGERQAPPKTEDGTDTEEQQECKTDRRSESPPAHEILWAGGATVANPRDNLCDTDSSGSDAGSWQGVYRNVLHKLNQSRSSRQHLSSGLDVASMLQEAGLANSTSKQSQMETPFACGTGQAPTDAAGAGIAESCISEAQELGSMLQLSLPHVDEPSASNSRPVEGATHGEQLVPHVVGQSGRHNSSSGGSSGTSAQNAAASSASTCDSELHKEAQGHCRLPVVVPSSAADLPVQAVLEELDQLLAWQTGRSSARAAVHHTKARASSVSGPFGGGGGTPHRPAAQELPRQEQDYPDEDMVSIWVRATQQQRGVARSNSDSGLLSEEMCDRSWCSSSCSMKKSRRKSNSMPSYNQGSFPTEDDNSDKASKIRHSKKGGSADLREEIISHLKMAAAFCPQSCSGSQPAATSGTSASLSTAAAVAGGSVQHNVDLVDWSSIDRYLDGASTPPADGSTRGSPQPSSCPTTPASVPRQIAEAELETLPGLHNIRTDRAHGAAAKPAVGSPTAMLNLPQRSESPKLTGSRSAQLYHKLLRGSLHGSSSGSPRSTPASSPTKQHHSSQGAGLHGQRLDGKVEKASALGKQSSAAGFPQHTSKSPDRQHKVATDESIELTCSSCGSLFSSNANFLHAVVAQQSNLSPHPAQAPALAGETSMTAMPAAAAQNADRPASPAAPVVAFASLSLSTLLGDRHRAAPSRGSDSLTGTPVRTLGASRISYSSRAASRKPLAECTAGTSMQAASNKPAVASLSRKLMAATKAASPMASRGGYASSAGKRVSRVKAVAAVRGSVVGAALCTQALAASPAGGVSGAMVSAISCGQLMQEAALHQAFSRVSGGAEEPQDMQQNKKPFIQDASSAPQQSHLDLQALQVHDSYQPASQPIRHSSARRPLDCQGRGRGECGSSRGNRQLTDVIVSMQATSDAAGSSPAAAAAAAAALQTLAAGAGMRGASVSPGRGSSSKPTAVAQHSRSNSAGPPSRPSASLGVSRSCSARSRASVSSNVSGSSPRVWRPGGKRTSAKDDCKKLQAYESARRALIGAGGDSCITPAASPPVSSPCAAKTAAALKQPASPHRRAAGSPSRSAKAGKTGPPQKAERATATTRAQQLGPAATAAAKKTKATPAAAARASAARQLPQATEQGVQADRSVAAGLDSAADLISELKRKLQLNGRQSSPGRMQKCKLSPPADDAASAPVSPIVQPKVSSTGQSSPTTTQVEEAIKAAQLALLQRRWQISQLRKAMQQQGMTPPGSASSSSSLAATAGGCRITAGSRAAEKGSAGTSVHSAGVGSDLASTSHPAAVPGLSASVRGRNTVVELGQDAPLPSEGFGTAQASTMPACIRQRHSAGGAATVVKCISLEAHQTDPAVGATATSVWADGHSLQASPVQCRSSNSSPFAAESYHSSGTTGGMRGLTVPSPAWSAPRRVSSSGKTADELIKYYRRTGAAETAEAAAVAAAEGACEGSMVSGAMNLDAMLRAYNALSHRRHSLDKSAALAALMSNVVAVAGVQALKQVTSAADEDEQDALKQGNNEAEQQDTLDGPRASINTAMAATSAAAVEVQDSSAVQAPAHVAGVADDALAAAAAEEGSGLVIVSMTVNGMGKSGAIKLKDTATGKAVLASIDGSSLTVNQAVHWLKVGLTRIPGTTSGGGAKPGQHGGSSSPGGPATAGMRSGSPAISSSNKSRPHSRSCSPFTCFAPVGRLSEDNDYDEGHLQGNSAIVPDQHQQPEDGVRFEMDASNQLLMVVPQHLSAGGLFSAATGYYRYTVTGVSLPGDSSRNSSNGGRYSSSGSNTSLSLELVTCAGRHRIDLASKRDWAGLLAGLNAMLLLREAQEFSKLAKQLENVPISEIAWSPAIEGVEV